MPSAVIVGCDGQDGRLLWNFLSVRKYELCGISRAGVKGRWSLSEAIDVCDPSQVDRLMEELRPDEVYYLAAFHHSAEDVPIGDGELYRHSHAVHVDGLLNFLESARRHVPQARLFYAASSLIFGDPATSPQDEASPVNPECIYGITKASGFHLVRNYRNRHGLFACSGILYNHESPLRAGRFVTQKIVSAALEIKRGSRSRLVLGDLSAATDWGYAPDFVAAMQGILQTSKPDDFVIATGHSHTVRDFVEITFAYLGLDWRRHVSEDGKIIARRRNRLVGNPAKLSQTTGWTPSVDLREMIHILLAAKGAFDE